MSDDTRFDPTDRSQYELTRAANVVVPLSPVRKARICGTLALFGALTGPLVATLPPAVREANFSGPPLAAHLGVVAVVLAGTVAAGGAGLGLVALQRRLARGPEPSDDQVWTFLALEDALTGIGFVTGGLGVGVGLVLLASGHWGVEALEALRRNGVEPYLSMGAIPTTPLLATAAGLIAGLGVLTATVVAVDGE
ncbi:hypothetical protein PN419_06940 [Halorubrum ezzemoulense]|jgi:hypothetical protein|uniref:Uncharacterized protein n=2 Tax=Halorubrum ezzemoulense TaxID=337243 RepID=A0A256K0J6_HALEZ|nr:MULTISPECIES: hypothetical protein [Halorubrum]MDB2224315.1 hypothetical protein [Halorubrum ezzemoulense]MDB2238249.1 hypothetical protein [Halorubrum ezzemoulense]MDB2240098.1 hypothetical protein [Halorubrum ezzemoulense]MDB2247718.1 hypothetical protein [Halorubrum ezzemoulense]MDB2252034.1 hypothetical protein [Halorubrum ezzemoulense]